MSQGKRRVYSREFKLRAVERVMAGESTAALSRDVRSTAIEGRRPPISGSPEIGILSAQVE